MQIHSRIILTFLLGLWLSSCSDVPTIQGKLMKESSEDGEYMAYLVAPETLEDLASPFQGVVLDSAEVGTAGDISFFWRPVERKEALLEIVLQKKGEKFPRRLENDSPMVSNYMPFIYSEGTMAFESKAHSFLADFQWTNPSEQNAAIMDLRDIRVQAYRNFLMGRSWDVHEGTELLEMEEAELNYQKELFGFADTTQYFFPAMVALRWVSPQLDYERVPEFLFSQCDKWKGHQHPWKERLCAMSEKQDLPIMVGAPFPNAVLPLADGREERIEELRGTSLTLLDIWASWCVPCRKENKEVLVPLWEKYHASGFEIIAYGLETNKNAWHHAIEKDGASRWINASHLQGDEAPLMKQLRIQTIPANFLIDSEGRILAKNLHGKSLKAFVNAYFKEN